MNDPCPSRYTLSKFNILKCEQHLGLPSKRKHTARYMGVRWYWTDAEADKEES